MGTRHDVMFSNNICNVLCSVRDPGWKVSSRQPLLEICYKYTEVYNGDENTKPDKHTVDDIENTYLTPTCVSQSLQYSDDDGYTVCQ